MNPITTAGTHAKNIMRRSQELRHARRIPISATTVQRVDDGSSSPFHSR